MTTPSPISQYAPTDDDQQQLEITNKKLLEGIPLVITDANNRNSKQYGPFWLIEATRTDTGEVVAFVGSKVIDKVMQSVKDAKAFPVAAVITKVTADNPQGYYWDLTDPPNTAVRTNGAVQPSGRVSEIGAFIDRGRVSVEDVQGTVKELLGREGKVAELDDAQYAELLSRLTSIDGVVSDAPPVDEDVPF